MTTSGSTDFRSTENNIIEDALRSLNVIRGDEALDASDYSYCHRMLNRMIKHWQAQDFYLWTKSTATIFLQAGQAEYLLNATSSDHATLSYTATSLDADYALGVSQISFNDNVNVNVGDYIGIVLDANTLYWDTIANIVDLNTVDLTGSLPSAASKDNAVYIYTTKLVQPFNVYSAVRQSEDDLDVPMFYLSYEDYFQLPNKTIEATPINYNYDRQLNTGRIVIWPVPIDVKYRMKITISKKIEDFDSVANTPDWPQEWEQALVSNLAIRVAPAYGKANDRNFQLLQLQANDDLKLASSFDSEQGSLYLQPDFYR